jgi:hypothetical protein
MSRFTAAIYSWRVLGLMTRTSSTVASAITTTWQCAALAAPRDEFAGCVQYSAWRTHR